MSKVRSVILHLQDSTTIEYESMAVLAKSLGAQVGDLRECVKTGLYLDYNWVRIKVTYKDGLGVGSSVGDGVQALMEIKNKNNKSFKTNARKIRAVSPTGEEKIYESIAETMKETGISHNNLKTSLETKASVADGWLFEDAPTNKSNKQLQEA